MSTYTENFLHYSLTAILRGEGFHSVRRKRRTDIAHLGKHRAAVLFRRAQQNAALTLAQGTPLYDYAA